MPHKMDYRVHTLHQPLPSDDDEASRLLTRLVTPSQHERGYADDWQILDVHRLTDGRLQLILHRLHPEPPAELPG